MRSYLVWSCARQVRKSLLITSCHFMRKLPGSPIWASQMGKEVPHVSLMVRDARQTVPVWFCDNFSIPRTSARLWVLFTHSGWRPRGWKARRFLEIPWYRMQKWSPYLQSQWYYFVCLRKAGIFFRKNGVLRNIPLNQLESEKQTKHWNFIHFLSFNNYL